MLQVSCFYPKVYKKGLRNLADSYVLVMCDISKKYRFRDNFVDIVIVSTFDTALEDFDIYRKGNIL